MSEYPFDNNNNNENQSGNTESSGYVFDPDRYADYEQVIQPQKKKSKGALVFVSVMLVAFIAGGIAIGAPYFKAGDSDGDTNKPGTSQNGDIVLQDRPDDDNVIPADGKLSTEQVAEQVSPSVVGILCYSSYNTVDASSSGSGIIMSKDGYIVTNAHVVENAVGISVKMEDGTEYTAKLIGADSKTDLAVVKIEGENFQFAKFGNSDQLKRGEMVVAIGNPGGMNLYGSVTVGYVSGLNRTLDKGDVYSLSLIQTDAAINPGNSGGALVNMYGQVIGINSSKIAATEFEGIGFAISINDAKPIIESLIENGYVKNRVKLGITVTELTETLANMNNVPKGLYIRGVVRGGSMDGTGAMVGDIITHINGQRVETYNDLQAELVKHNPGDQISVTLYRRLSSTTNKTLDVTVVLQEDTGVN